jgi:hypothetical protein
VETTLTAISSKQQPAAITQLLLSPSAAAAAAVQAGAGSPAAGGKAGVPHAAAGGGYYGSAQMPIPMQPMGYPGYGFAPGYGPGMPAGFPMVAGGCWFCVFWVSLFIQFPDCPAEAKARGEGQDNV